MMPTPTPAPPMPIAAMPAPMYFAATGSITKLLPVLPLGRASMARVNRIVEIDASEDGEDVGLQEGDQHFQRHQDDDHREGQNAADPAEHAERAAEQDDEAREHLQRDVAGQHVGEQTHAVRDRPDRNERISMATISGKM